MKKKISIAAIVIAVILGIYFVFAPRQVGDNGVAPPDIDEALQETEQSAGQPDESTPDEVQPAGVEADERVQRMREEYAVLEEKREALSNRLDDLRARLYNVELPAGQAREVNDELKKAFMLITNPPMLGAFHEVSDIHSEIDKVERAQRKLNEIGNIIDEVKGGEG